MNDLNLKYAYLSDTNLIITIIEPDTTSQLYTESTCIIPLRTDEPDYSLINTYNHQLKLVNTYTRDEAKTKIEKALKTPTYYMFTDMTMPIHELLQHVLKLTLIDMINSTKPTSPIRIYKIE